MSTPRLVTFANHGGVETPPDLLRALRQLDDTVELVCVGEGLWWLGRVRPTDERRHAGEVILAAESRRTTPNPRNVALGQLALQGFARVQGYTQLGLGGDCVDEQGYHCNLVEDFRERLYHWRKDGGDAVVAEKFGMSDRERAQRDAELRHYARTDGLAHYRRVMRNRVVVGVDGLKPAQPGRLILPSEF